MISHPLCRAAVAVMLAITLVGCRGSGKRSSAEEVWPDAPGRAMFRTELIFGLSREDGEAISEKQWQQFVDDAVAVWFPNGFTIIDGVGRWRNLSGKIVDERSKILLILHEGDEKTMRKLDEVRSLYGQRFGQQAVIRESTRVWVAF